MSVAKGQLVPVSYTAYSYKQAAEILGIPVARIRAMIARRALVSLHEGFVTTDSVERQRHADA